MLLEGKSRHEWESWNSELEFGPEYAEGFGNLRHKKSLAAQAPLVQINAAFNSEH